MKVKIVEIKQGYTLIYKKKSLNVGDVIDVPKERGEALISRGVAEKVKETPKSKKE